MSADRMHVALLCWLACALGSCDTAPQPGPDPAQDQFECADGNGLLPIEWRCDRFTDCADGSDELDCGFDCMADAGAVSIRPDLVCDHVLDCQNGADEVGVDWMDRQCTNFFSCADGAGSFLPSAFRCDGAIDCADGSDEDAKECGGFELFACPDGELGFACDGVVDCADRSDELEAAGCAPFTCDDGEVIPSTWFCDGLADCSAAEDEPDETCLDRRFTCESSQLFIPAAWECDTRVDCADGSDEANCEGRIFACDELDSVPDELLCDDKEHCPNGLDEVPEVACPETAFRCDDGELILCLYRCDGNEQCDGGEDEAECPEFACADGTALPAAFHCDLIRDCPDGSDEVDCEPGGPLGLCPAP